MQPTKKEERRRAPKLFGGRSRKENTEEERYEMRHVQEGDHRFGGVGVYPGARKFTKKSTYQKEKKNWNCKEGGGVTNTFQSC